MRCCQGLSAAAALTTYIFVPGVFLSQPARAAGLTQGTLSVSTTVSAICTMTINPMLFSSYSTTGATEAKGSIDIFCTNGTPYTITLNAGTGTNATLASTRALTGTAQPISLMYNLYKNSDYTELWGDGTGTSQTVLGTGTGQSVTIPVYGRISSGQLPTAQTYGDTVTVTINY